jgi:hypothetical protein
VIDKLNDVAAVSTGYNNVKGAIARPDLAGSDDVLTFMKGPSGRNGSVVLMKNCEIFEKIRDKCDKDIKWLKDEQDSLLDDDDFKNVIIESSIENIRNSVVYCYEVIDLDGKYTYRERKIDTVDNILRRFKK